MAAAKTTRNAEETAEVTECMQRYSVKETLSING